MLTIMKRLHKTAKQSLQVWHSITSAITMCHLETLGKKWGEFNSDKNSTDTNKHKKNEWLTKMWNVQKSTSLGTIARRKVKHWWNNSNNIYSHKIHVFIRWHIYIYREMLGVTDLKRWFPDSLINSTEARSWSAGSMFNERQMTTTEEKNTKKSIWRCSG